MQYVYNRTKLIIQHFSKLAEFTAHCQVENDWTSFVEHKLQHPSDSLAKVVLWYSSNLISQRLGVQIPAEVREYFLFLKLSSANCHLEKNQ